MLDSDIKFVFLNQVLSPLFIGYRICRMTSRKHRTMVRMVLQTVIRTRVASVKLCLNKWEDVGSEG